MSLVGVSDHIVELRAWCAAVGPSPCRVVITGETGTGKGLVARLLHTHSGRTGPFVQRGAGETASTLLQDDLFGHVRGAYTGATERRRGLLETADGGTLFLDELQDFSVDGQRALLLFLDGHGFAPQGSDRRIHPEVRVIAAAQRPLGELVGEGLLRRDLLYRLRQVTIVWIGTSFAPIRISGRVVSASMTQRVGGRGWNPGEWRFRGRAGSRLKAEGGGERRAVSAGHAEGPGSGIRSGAEPGRATEVSRRRRGWPTGVGPAAGSGIGGRAQGSGPGARGCG